MPKVRWVISYRFCSEFYMLSVAQKFWKSVKIWQSYREFKGGPFFETQCRLVSAVSEGVGSLSSKISDTREHPPPTIFARIDRPMPYNIAAESFHTKKLCCRLSSRKVQFSVRKTKKLSSLRPLWLGATYAVHLRLIGKLVGDFLLVIIELFSLGAFVLSQLTRLTDGRTDRQRDRRTDRRS